MALPGLGWKAARARIAAAIAGFRPRVRAEPGFRAEKIGPAAIIRDERGTVAIQALIFSILLFGTTGLVLDAGRVYAMHSQMQAYADQVALAAANELDGHDDAIERAGLAAFGETAGGTSSTRPGSRSGPSRWRASTSTPASRPPRSRRTRWAKPSRTMPGWPV